jgi:DNA-binding IclR family transcriptional regulator
MQGRLAVDKSHRARSSPDIMTSSLRCLHVLDVLARDPYAFSLTEIASLLSVAKSTAHRLLSTLMAAGFVERDAESGRYQLAGKTLWVGTAYLRHSDVYRCGFAVVDDLAGRAKTMAHLAVWDNDAVLYLNTLGPPRSLSLFADTGERRPVHATALGKVMLAHRPDADLQRVFSRGCERFTENTITSLAAMREELQRIRQLGYAVDDEEGISGLRCVAASVKDRRAHVVAGISVSGPRTLVTDEAVPRFARLVQEAALRLSVQLGHRPPTSNLSSLLTPLPRRESA